MITFHDARILSFKFLSLVFPFISLQPLAILSEYFDVKQFHFKITRRRIRFDPETFTSAGSWLMLSKDIRVTSHFRYPPRSIEG